MSAGGDDLEVGIGSPAARQVSRNLSLLSDGLVVGWRLTLRCWFCRCYWFAIAVVSLDTCLAAVAVAIRSDERVCVVFLFLFLPDYDQSYDNQQVLHTLVLLGPLLSDFLYLIIPGTFTCAKQNPPCCGT